jgi:uncharacterized protein with PQ loop repeat
MSIQDDRFCDVFRDPSKSTFAASLTIAVGIVLSYLPQYYNIVKTRTSIGLSPVFLLLISIAGLAATSNLVLLSFLSLPCCRELTRFECVNSQVSLFQVGIQALCTLLITWFCVKFTSPSEEEPAEEYYGIKRTWDEIKVAIVFISTTLVVAYFTFSKSSILLYAKFLGLFSTTLTVIQYLPQLYATYKLKKSGVLSILMMCIQTPGGYLWTATLMLKPGSHWSSWLPYFTAATCQGLLLILSVYYDYFTKQEDKLPLLDDDTTTTTATYDASEAS